MFIKTEGGAPRPRFGSNPGPPLPHRRPGIDTDPAFVDPDGGDYHLADGDMDCDGDIELSDLAAFLSRYGSSCDRTPATR